MRPINLIPPEQRRGEHAPLRSGPLAYMVVAGLVLVLAGVTALVLTGNQVSEREGDVARLEVEDAAAKAEAERLASYTRFRDLSEQRVATVASLADSRFDWERVMRELSLILPSDVWLVGLEASAGGGAGAEGGASAAGIAGPSISLSGCANGQEGVARFVIALKDIDGVTRVGVESSELPERGAGGDGGGGSDGGDECRTREFIAKFEIVVAFDAAPVPAVAGAAEATPVATTESEGDSEEEGSEEDDEGSEEG